VRLGSLIGLFGIAIWLFAAPAYAAADGDGESPAHDGSRGARVEGVYLTIAPLIVTVFRKDGGVGRISAVFTLEMASETLAAAAAVRHTKLRDALIQELQRLSAREERLGREFSIAQIKRRMKTVIVRRLGEDAVRDVLVQALNRS